MLAWLLQRHLRGWEPNIGYGISDWTQYVFFECFSVQTWIDDILAKYQITQLPSEADWLHNVTSLIDDVTEVLKEKGIPGYSVTRPLSNQTSSSSDSFLQRRRSKAGKAEIERAKGFPSRNCTHWVVQKPILQYEADHGSSNPSDTNCVDGSSDDRD